MVIVEDTSGATRRGKVVGFLEIGMLPKPSSSEESALAGEALTAKRAAAALATAAAAAGKGRGKGAGRSSLSPATRLGAGTGTAAAAAAEEEDRGSAGDGSGTTAIKRERQPDVAYLANVVVDRRQRRRGIGRTMVSSAIEIVRELWPLEESIFVSVEQARTREGAQGERGWR